MKLYNLNKNTPNNKQKVDIKLNCDNKYLQML